MVSAENFFLKVQREERENPDARAETYPTYPVISAAEGKIILSSPCIVVFVSTGYRGLVTFGTPINSRDPRRVEPGHGARPAERRPSRRQ